MTSARFFFEVPLYWCDQGKFETKYTQDLEVHMGTFAGGADTKGEHLPRSAIAGIKERFGKGYVAPWRYNQVVGWIRLFVTGPQIRGDLWLCSNQRYSRRMNRKHITLTGKAFELHCWPHQSSQEIAHLVRTEIVSSVRRTRNGQLTPDLECFDNMSSSLNWCQLVFGRTNRSSSDTIHSLD